MAIDIGAHVGDSTLPIALAIGPSGVVLALETLEELVRERRPLLQVEFFTERKAPPGYRARLLDRLTGHGYRVYRVEERSGDWGQEEIDPGNLHRHKTFDAFCVPREVA